MAVSVVIPDWVPSNSGRPSAGEINGVTRDPVSQTVAAENTYVPIPYGRSRVFGRIFAIGMDTDGRMVLGYAFCEGPVTQVESVLVDGVATTDPAGFLAPDNVTLGAAVNVYTGSYSQVPDPLLEGCITGYTDTLRGYAYAVLRVPPGINVGFPQVEAIIQGRKVYDPRKDSTNGGSGSHRLADSSTWEYSTNPTLCFADFMTQYARRTVIWSSVIDGANENDRLVGPTGSQQVSRTMGLMLSDPQQVGDWIKAFRTYMGANIAWELGSIRIIPERKDLDVQGAALLPGVEGFTFAAGNAFNFGALDSMTVEAWVTPVGTTRAAILAKKLSYTATGAGWALGVLDDQRPYFVVADGTTRVEVQGAATLNDGPWHHVAGVVDRAAELLRLYVDTNQVATASIAGLGSLTNAVSMDVGSLSNLTECMAGRVDEIRVWDVARTEANLKSLQYDEAEPQAGLKVAYRCNEGQPSESLSDASGNSYDAGAWGPASATFVPGNPDIVPLGTVKHFKADDIVDGSLQLRRRGNRQYPTVIRVEYTNVDDNWRVDYREASLAGVSDGTVPRRLSVIRLPGVQRPAQAYREAVERLNWFVSDLEVTFKCFDEGLKLQQGSIIAVTHPIGLLSKMFRVRKLTNEQSRWIVEGVEYDPQIYSEAVIVAPSTPDTTLPDPLHPPALTSVVAAEKLFQYKDGTWGSHIEVSWDPPAYPYISQYQVDGYAQVDGVPTLKFTLTTTGTTVVSPPVEDFIDQGPVTYDVRVAVQSPYKTGAYAQTTLVVLGKFAPPGPVPQVTAEQIGADTIRLTWGRATDIDIWQYEIREAIPGAGGGEDTIESPLLWTADATSPYDTLSPKGDDALGWQPIISSGGVGDWGGWSTARFVDRKDGLEAIIAGLTPGVHRFYVRALDSVRNYSATDAFVDITISKPLAPTNLQGYEAGGIVRLSWEASLSRYVDRYRITIERTTAPTYAETTLDVVDGLRSAIPDLDPATYTFRVYARDSAGVDSDTNIPSISVTVTSDAAVYLADFTDFATPDGVLTNFDQWSLRDFASSGERFFVTNMGDAFTNTTFTDYSAAALANYHSSGASEWRSANHDFGLDLSAVWNLTHSVQALAGTVTVIMQGALTATPSTWFDIQPGTRTTARYIRVKITTSGTSTAFVVTPLIRVRAIVVPSEEGGEATSNSGSAYTVSLSRAYAKVVEIQLQSKFSGSPAARSEVVDNIQLNNGGVTTFDVHIYDSGGTRVSQAFYWRFKGV